MFIPDLAAVCSSVRFWARFAFGERFFQLNGLPQTIENINEPPPPTWNDVCEILSLVDSCSRMCLLPDKRWWFSSMAIWESFSAGFEGCGVLEFVF